MYKYIFFGVISVGRQKLTIKGSGYVEKLKEQMFYEFRFQDLKHNINTCLSSKPRCPESSSKNSKPLKYPPYPSTLPQYLDLRVQFQHKHPSPLLSF